MSYPLGLFDQKSTLTIGLQDFGHDTSGPGEKSRNLEDGQGWDSWSCQKKSAEPQALAVGYHPEYHPPNMKYHLISQ